MATTSLAGSRRSRPIRPGTRRSQPIDNGVLVFVGTVGIALIALDDLTGIGVVDDILIPVIGAACFCDVNQLVPKKQRCTLCGGEWYGY